MKNWLVIVEKNENFFNEKIIPIHFVYNLDEVGFDIFVDTTKKVIKRDDFKRHVVTLVDNVIE